MKLRIEATPEELQTKGPALLQALRTKLLEHDPETAELLAKALLVQPSSEAAQEHEGDVQAFPAVEAMIARAHKLYAEMLVQMLDEIGEAIDDRVAEVLAPAAASGNVVDLNAKRG